MWYLVMFYFVVSLRFAKCGLDPLITGGEYTKYEQYPHAVFLIIHGDEGDFVCGGSVVNQNIILTAAHCLHVDGNIKDTKHKKVEIKYGHELIKKMKTIYMKQHVIHEHYDEDKLLNDVCLALTKNEIPLGVVKRVILMKNPPKAEYAYVAGWGFDENEELQYTLKHTHAKMQRVDICRGMGWLPVGVFCAGPETGLGAADRGDSGGALIIEEYIQIGLVSYKMPMKSLVGYTNVSYFFDWIEINALELYCP